MRHIVNIKFIFNSIGLKKPSKYKNFKQFEQVKKTNALKNKILMLQNMIKQLLTHV
ncbi:hypothetical protein GCM10011416_03560 [Polaribacter pacificus]|uniref:Uncharacterized protein n=1 Tax=Polaribacter pacificus TaxID=1775173 RepID=A0A917HV17_9FLAO|nr:hypothetical protein GCM10011416_03560 [Polaribacter pacificus]